MVFAKTTCGTVGPVLLTRYVCSALLALRWALLLVLRAEVPELSALQGCDPCPVWVTN